MVTRVFSLTWNGVSVVDVDVQAHISSGIPCFTIVGLADKTITEAKERVKVALMSIGLALPAKKILINLAPADLVKEGSHFDLAIACAVLAGIGVLPKEELEEYLILGELSLDGSLLPVCGVLPAAIGALDRGRGIICPESNGKEAVWSGNKNVLAPNNLLALINHFKGTQILGCPEIAEVIPKNRHKDLYDVIGQIGAKKAVEVAAAGRHHLLMSGPPGTGKSMLAQRLPSILPEMTPQEILECSMIASVAGLIRDGNLVQERPFRAPHHSASLAAMVGGGVGRKVKPGEISLAHNGVLFLDEFPEFPSSVIDALRQPLESSDISISRVNFNVKYPANFQLIAAMNPCKCGYLTNPARNCNKAPQCGLNYQAKVSGPIMDRFDLYVEVPELQSYCHNPVDSIESSDSILQRIRKAHQLQMERYQGYGISFNSQLYGQLIIDFAIPNNEGQKLINESANKFKLSMRAYNKVLKVARTIADLEESKIVNKYHIAEALSYRYMNYR